MGCGCALGPTTNKKIIDPILKKFLIKTKPKKSTRPRKSRPRPRPRAG